MTTRRREFLGRAPELLHRSRTMAAEFLAHPGQVDSRPVTPDRRPEPTPAAVRATEQPSAQPPEATQSPDTALAGICSSLAMRDLNLVDSLLSQLEQMESSEEDHNRLDEL